jgi:cell shape-determining protein MreD
MILNKKILNYKIVSLDECYNFHIKFIFIQIHTNKLRFFEDGLVPTAIWNGSRIATVPTTERTVS